MTLDYTIITRVIPKVITLDYSRLRDIRKYIKSRRDKMVPQSFTPIVTYNKNEKYSCNIERQTS